GRRDRSPRRKLVSSGWREPERVVGRVCPAEPRGARRSSRQSARNAKRSGGTRRGSSGQLRVSFGGLLDRRLARAGGFESKRLVVVSEKTTAPGLSSAGRWGFAAYVSVMFTVLANVKGMPPPIA